MGSNSAGFREKEKKRQVHGLLCVTGDLVAGSPRGGELGDGGGGADGEPVVDAAGHPGGHRELHLSAPQVQTGRRAPSCTTR